MRTLIRRSDWPTHIAAVALVLLLVVPATDQSVAPVLIGAGALAAAISGFGFWSMSRRHA